MSSNNQNRNISKMLEAAAKQVREGKYGDLTLFDAVEVTAAAEYLSVKVKKDSVTRKQPTNKTVIGNPFFWSKK